MKVIEAKHPLVKHKIGLMLATGGSMIPTLDLLKKAGCSSIKVLVLLAVPEGVAALVTRAIRYLVLNII
ncbi:MAG: hypothetical protein G5663_01165 [Serratia symbiotica]|nr:hypothetical protein [Serratia symbiotica]